MLLNNFKSCSEYKQLLLLLLVCSRGSAASIYELPRPDSSESMQRRYASTKFGGA